jgi:hypothetical protein
MPKPNDISPPRSRAPASRSGNHRTRSLTPLWIISSFLSLSEVIVGVAAAKTDGGVQWLLVAFAVAFPVLVAAAFFLLLFFRPWMLYHPAEYGSTDVSTFVAALSGSSKLVKSTADVAEQIDRFGDPDQFKLLFKVQSSPLTWKKSTKAMVVPGGCLVQVTTERLGADDCWRVSEALAFVPGVSVVDGDGPGAGRSLGGLPGAHRGAE